MISEIDINDWVKTETVPAYKIPKDTVVSIPNSNKLYKSMGIKWGYNAVMLFRLNIDRMKLPVVLMNLNEMVDVYVKRSDH